MGVLKCLTINDTLVDIELDPKTRHRGTFKGPPAITGDIDYGAIGVEHKTPRFKHDVHLSFWAAYHWPRRVYPA